MWMSSSLRPVRPSESKSQRKLVGSWTTHLANIEHRKINRQSSTKDLDPIVENADGISEPLIIINKNDIPNSLDHHPQQASLSTSKPLRSLGCLGSCHPPTCTTKANRWRYAPWQPLKSTWNTNMATIHRKIWTSGPECWAPDEISVAHSDLGWAWEWLDPCYPLDCWMGNEAMRHWMRLKENCFRTRSYNLMA